MELATPSRFVEVHFMMFAHDELPIDRHIDTMASAVKEMVRCSGEDIGGRGRRRICSDTWMVRKAFQRS